MGSLEFAVEEMLQPIGTICGKDLPGVVSDVLCYVTDNTKLSAFVWFLIVVVDTSRVLIIPILCHIVSLRSLLVSMVTRH